MRCDQGHPVSFEVVIEPIAGTGPIANAVFGFGLQHGEVKTELHQRNLIMIGHTRTDPERQPVAIHNHEDFHALAALGEPDSVDPALGCHACDIDETLAFVDRPSVVQRIGQLGQDRTPNLAITSLLQPMMHRLVVGIALRQQVPLLASVRIQSTASKTARVCTDLRPGRLSGICSSGKCSRICSH